MLLPSRVQTALGTLIAGGAGLTLNLQLSSPIHKLILLVAGVVLFVLNPQAASPEAALDAFPPAGANQTPAPPAGTAL
jgi:uncharacterized membrane protein YccC